jgi:hypothetical protein
MGPILTAFFSLDSLTPEDMYCQYVLHNIQEGLRPYILRDGSLKSRMFQKILASVFMAINQFLSNLTCCKITVYFSIIIGRMRPHKQSNYRITVRSIFFKGLFYVRSGIMYIRLQQINVHQKFAGSTIMVLLRINERVYY